MRATVFRDGKLFVATVADPVAGQGQVLVKTLCCGICGSDLHAAKFPRQFAEVSRRSGSRLSLNPDRDVVFGHEFCCEIVEHGPGTDKALKPGTRVVSMPLSIAGRNVIGLGYNPEVAGGFSEYMALSERMLLPVPNGLSSEKAALTEPTGKYRLPSTTSIASVGASAMTVPFQIAFGMSFPSWGEIATC